MSQTSGTNYVHGVGGGDGGGDGKGDLSNRFVLFPIVDSGVHLFFLLPFSNPRG